MKTEEIKHLIEPVLTEHHLFLVELKISKDNVIEVFVDALEGVNIQTCIAVSREIESSLNRDGEDFELTVSSAGLGYPFKVEQQYQKNLGKSVEIKLNDHTKLNGILLRFTPEEIVIEQEEKKLIYNVFDFSDSVAKDIMIPRIDMTTIDVEASYNELLTLFKESMYTRIPVYEDDSDNIIGIINVKDFLLVSNKRMFKIRDIMREAYYTYEYKKTADLLLEMRNITANVALVLNEYGATVGMITLEDLLEEIVGEIRDEYDEDEDELIQQVDDHTYLVDASMKLSDINDAIGTSFDSEDFDSIGGIIIGLLDRFPSQGETVTTEDGIILTATEVIQNRIEKVTILLPESQEQGDAASSEHSESESSQEASESQSVG